MSTTNEPLAKWDCGEFEQRITKQDVLPETARCRPLRTPKGCDPDDPPALLSMASLSKWVQGGTVFLVIVAALVIAVQWFRSSGQGLY